MIKWIVIIAFGLLIAMEYALLVNNSRKEKELKEEMCKQARSICTHECDICAWRH